MKTVGNIYIIAATSVIGGALFGFDISSMSAIISTQPYKCQFNQQGNNPITGQCQGPDDVLQGGITAAMPGGSWLGALISGFLSDIFGRKKAIQIGAVIWVIGSILVCASQNIPMLIVGRIINGLSVGICSAQVPVYISEISPPSKRGRLIGMQQWAITWGIAIMFFLCYGSSFIRGAAAFRLPWGLQMIPAIILFFGLLILPESPRWLAKHDRWEEAHEVLVLVHGKGDPRSALVAKEMAEIREVVEFERANADVSYLELFRPRMINRTHIGVFTQIWSQLTGMNVMMYYIAYIFTMTGSGDDVLLPSGIQFIINVVMTVPALIWLDRWGRRPTMLAGAFFMCLWLCINAGLFGAYSRPAVPEDGFDTAAISMVISGRAAKAVIASTYLFVASFATTWGPASWTYPAELYPLRVRGKAVALSTSSNWAFNFALAYFVPPAFANISWRTYVLFAVFCFAMFWHTFFLFPETANKTLEEVADIFENNNPGSIKYIGTPAWKTHNDRSILRVERNLVSSEEKIGIQHSTESRPQE
ncbi:general substrate transporter [Durotheca rogersii]|uniref:general substrate transporter n=1 Tax=Durotheca rogersii TaxID=419775 RepID=UPI0022211A78|nr:general substrate transporter [Durotheca rogersii]KAI5861214.1 general substrate transporter [Durotheca rogersii]